MATAAKFSTTNKLLLALSSQDLELLRPSLFPIVLRLKHEFERPNQRISDLIFPDTGIVSVVALHPNQTGVEIGVIGGEGVTGSAVLLGNDSSPHQAYVQVAGRGVRISTGDFRKAMQTSPSLQSLLHKYVQTFMVQTAQTAIANARATLPQRLARWLLMARDRVPGDKLPLTHEFLSLMMGVRRAGVTEAMQALTRQKLTNASRGQITVLNRKGLEKLAGNFYGIPEAEYRRLLG
jgi:CRP-like cAMP-binding protein